MTDTGSKLWCAEGIDTGCGNSHGGNSKRRELHVNIMCWMIWKDAFVTPISQDCVCFDESFC
jgi:hypothetical protein